MEITRDVGNYERVLTVFITACCVWSVFFDSLCPLVCLLSQLLAFGESFAVSNHDRVMADFVTTTTK